MRTASRLPLCALALAFAFAATPWPAHAEKTAKKSPAKAKAESKTEAKAETPSEAPAEAAAAYAAGDAPGAAPATEPAAEAPKVPKPPKWTNGPASSGAMALTYDDGPHTTFTPQLLEILKNADAKATFFMLGTQVDLNPEIAKTVAEAGHEIANHSYSHRDMNKMTTEQIRDEIKRTQDVIQAATGVRPTLFRPPYGNFNKKVIEVCEEEGLEIVTWSIDPRDWDAKQTSDSVKDKILKQAAPGAIVCIHDIHKRTITATPEIIAGLKAKNLRLTTAGDLIEQQKKAIAEGKTSVAGGEALADEAPPQPTTVPLAKTRFRKTIY